MALSASSHFIRATPYPSSYRQVGVDVQTNISKSDAARGPVAVSRPLKRSV